MLSLTRSELMDITEDWVEAAFSIDPKDRAYMERLVMAQNRRSAVSTEAIEEATMH
ncbi:enoyl-CoA hydratase [compost metagenome]